MPITDSRKAFGGIQTDGGPWMCDSCPPCHANDAVDRRESAGGADKQAQLADFGSLVLRMANGRTGRAGATPRATLPWCALGRSVVDFLGAAGLAAQPRGLARAHLRRRRLVSSGSSSQTSCTVGGRRRLETGVWGERGGEGCAPLLSPLRACAVPLRPFCARALPPSV